MFSGSPVLEPCGYQRYGHLDIGNWPTGHWVTPVMAVTLSSVNSLVCAAAKCYSFSTKTSAAVAHGLVLPRRASLTALTRV
jgi:hypothetical protein